MPVDENRSSILKKQKELKEIVKQFPRFRSGLLQLAISYLQLGRNFEAINALKSYHDIDPNDPTIEYYLAALSVERKDYNKAWAYLKHVEKIALEKNHRPKALRDLRLQLRALNPDPVLFL